MTLVHIYKILSGEIFLTIDVTSQAHCRLETRKDKERQGEQFCRKNIDSFQKDLILRQYTYNRRSRASATAPMLILSEIYIALLHCHCPWREIVKCIVVSEWQEWKQGKFTCKMNQPRTWHQQCWLNTYAVPIGNDDAIADDNAHSDTIAQISHHQRWCTQWACNLLMPCTN